MGIVSSICKRKKRNRYKATSQDNSRRQVDVSTLNPSFDLSNDMTQCAAITREPVRCSQRHHQNYTQPLYTLNSTTNQYGQVRENIPLFSRPFYLPHSQQINISDNRSKPYGTQAHGNTFVPISETNRSRAILMTSLNDRADIVSGSSHVKNVDKSYCESKQLETSMTTDKIEQPLHSKIDDESQLVKRSSSTPMDMFLIDISHEYVRIGQDVSMNIRHLLLDSLENHRVNSSAPIRVEPSSVTTYAHESLLDYIPRVCDRYPNVIVNSDQSTRNTVHLRIPSQFSRSMNALTE